MPRPASRGNRGTDHVAECRHHRTLAGGLADRGQSVGGFAGLTDRNHQRIRFDDRVAVTKLRRLLHRGGDSGDVFEVVLPDQSGVHAAAASGDHNPGDLREFARGQVQAGEDRVAHLEIDPAADRVFDGFRLFKDLFEHEVRIISLFGGGGVPVDLGDFAFDRHVFDVAQVDLFRSQQRDVAVVEVDHLPGVGQQRGDVAGDEVLVFADADDDRTSFAGDHDLIRIEQRDDRKSVGPGELLKRRCGRGEQVPLVSVRDQVGDHFAVGFGAEGVSFGPKMAPQLLMVFDDAVVDNRKAAGFIEVGMCVRGRRCAVGCPAGMGDAAAAEGFEFGPGGDGFRERLDFPDTFDGVEPALRGHRQAGGVIPAILQSFESVDQDGATGRDPTYPMIPHIKFAILTYSQKCVLM